ncbi:adenosine kinase [Paucidesulfovibrio gracilis DSM 16080]|uniref:Adenosine kinase n=1 Tax=Paucidesulfovibrio gracilis DSM 16080 TaxID=1121449 RepID=A0A1T4WKC5_9BACT|nr:carbohydrate kinase family protein [Paucidesulfovibrio gracilis]SKA77617.1 adenosine kinase [Paucidesulfovibrio gracilis DSM 16080]
MSIYISGSLAIDRIMPFPGRFQDHILSDKIHILNVCFLVDGMEERFGGTAGNIAYNLALLGEKPTVLSCVGKDFDRYERRMAELELPMDGVRVIDNDFTASAFITTDQSDNQITAFNPAAMRNPCEYDVSAIDPKDSLAIVSPGNVEDMIELPRKYRAAGIPYIFDPGQQITALSGEQLEDALTGAAILTTNDYELEMVMKATNMDKAQLLEKVGAIVTTLGEHGSSVLRSGEAVEIPICPATPVADPTGAGDAYRAGMLYGLSLGRDLPEACKLGAVCSAYCVERNGTQEHSFTLEEFTSRYEATFGPM